jgi:hypothetical protein
MSVAESSFDWQDRFLACPEPIPPWNFCSGTELGPYFSELLIVFEENYSFVLTRKETGDLPPIPIIHIMAYQSKGVIFLVGWRCGTT